MVVRTMRNYSVITVLLLFSLSWISDSVCQTVEAQSGEDVALLCSNFSSAVTQTLWFRVVRRSQPRCVSSMFQPQEPARFCEGFQSGKFEMRSNISTLFLTIRHVDLSDSGLYFCGYYIGKDPVITAVTHLEVHEVLDGITKLMNVILGALTVFLVMVIICLAVKIKKLQRAHVEEQNPQHRESGGSDDLTYAAVTFHLNSKRNHRPAADGEEESSAIYTATR